MLILGGETALLKVQATRTFELCAREAAQIFGGNSYVRGGRGEKIERLYREVRAYAIPGGRCGACACAVRFLCLLRACNLPSLMHRLLVHVTIRNDAC
jgi:hypothetical protein